MTALARTESVSEFVGARHKFEQLVTYLDSAEAHSMKHSDLERELEARGRKLLRELYQEHLDLRAPGAATGEVRDAEGVERTHKREHERDLETVFGTVTVGRLGYGVEGQESLHPLDAELNLPPERYSHELRHRAAEEASKSSFDETVEVLGRHTGARIAKRQVEELVQRAAQDFDAFYEARQAAGGARSQTNSLLVLTADGKGVVMRRLDLREATRKKAEQGRHKLQKRLSKGEKRNAKRMATVASVYQIAPFVRLPEELAGSLAPMHETVKLRRPRPENKRVWASLEKNPEQVLDEAFREALHRDPGQRNRWVALVDGQKTQLDLLKKLARKHRVELTIVLDLIHVLEYLWKAAQTFHEQGSSNLEVWVQERLLRILRGAAGQVAAGMRRSATRRQLNPDQRKPVDLCANYLLKYKSYLKYDQYLADGLPIATGVIEGACRHLVKDRMDLTGARWSLDGAEAVLRLRALRASHDFDEYWSFHEAREYERNHAARYAAGEVPSIHRPTRRTKRSRPTLVK